MRIYITSRNRTPSSASPSDFQFAIQRPIELPEGGGWNHRQFHVLQRLGGSPGRRESDPVLQIQLHGAADAGARTRDITSVADLAAKLTTGLAALNPFEPPCISYSVWEQVGVRLSWARGWPTLHGGLAQDPELRPFSLYTTIGEMGRRLSPRRGNDQGHPLFKPSGCSEPGNRC